MNKLTKFIVSSVLLGIGGTSFAQDQGSPPNSLIVDDSGRVGVGTATPVNKFEVVGDDGATTRARVVENNGTTALRALFSMVNNGPPNFAFVDTSPNGKDWNFRGSLSGPFSISENSSGVVEMTLRVGTGGAVFAGPVSSGSSRAVKRNFVGIDPQDILSKVVDLPVSKWTYNSEPNSVRHLGPTAEDFHAKFGLGINKTSIASVDSAGVALAAIQGLHQLMTEKDEKIAALENQNQKLNERIGQLEDQQGRIAALEEVVTRLASDQLDTIRKATMAH